MVRSILLPYAFVWEKCSEFQMTSSLEPLGQFCSKFMWSVLRLGERKIAKMVAVSWPRWLPCSYMVKTFKNLLLQNRGCIGAESLHKSLGTGGPQWLMTYANKCCILTFDLFTARSSLLPYAFVWEKPLKILFSKPRMPCGWICTYIIGNWRSTKVAKIMVVHWHWGQFCFLMHLYGKNIQNFKRLLLWSLWANCAQISYGASLGWGNVRLLKWLRFIDQDGRHALIC